MNELLLTPDSVLEGSQIVQIRTRPVRTAFIVPDDNPQVAVRAIDSCCLTWGGASQFLIPYDRESGFTDEWRTILDFFDPDDLIDCAGMAEEDREFRTIRGQFVHVWENPLESFFILGALQYSALKASGRGRRGDVLDIVISPMADADDPLYLPAIANWGHLDERFVAERLQLMGTLDRQRYNHFFRIEHYAVMESDTVEVLARGYPDTSRLMHRLESGGSVYKLVDLSLTGIGSVVTSMMGGDTPPERPQFDEAMAERVLVTGRSNSVSDLCFYWNIRARRPHAWSMPAWIPLSILNTDLGMEALNLALARTADARSEEIGQVQGLHVISTSLDTPALMRELPSEIEVGRYETTGFGKYLANDLKLGQTEVKELPFSQGMGRMPRPPNEFVDRFSRIDRVTEEVSIRGFHLPQSRSLRQRLGGVVSRISKDGLEHFFYPDRENELTPIRVPSRWVVLQSIFRDAGYACKMSDKGRTALAIVGLFGGVQGLRILSQGRVHELLGRLSAATGRQASSNALRRIFQRMDFTPADEDIEQIVDFVNRELPVDAIQRPDLTFQQIQQILGRDRAEGDLKQLIERQIVFRGSELTCPACSLRKWYPIDRFGELITCDGCQKSVKFPGSLHSATWRYKVNELYAKGYDQGVIPHLLLMQARTPSGRLHFDSSTLGFHPGIEIRAMEGREVGLVPSNQTMEIDFVEVYSGKPIIAECKVAGSEITEEELRRLISVAEEIGCARVFLAAMTNFSERRELIDQIGANSQCEIQLFEGEQMLVSAE